MLVVSCQTGRGRGTASGQQQGRRGVGGRGVAFDDFGRRVGGSRLIALNVNGRIVRRRLGAAVENGDGDSENADDTAERAEAKPAFVKFTQLVAKVIRENGRETNRRADQ